MNNLRRPHFVLLSLWFVINLLQAIFTELHADESYYWLYSQNLDWGFFDHPPMVALLISLGDSVVHAEIGVRIFVLILSTLSVAIIMNELNEKKDFLFLSVFLLSFPLMHTQIGGFLALPDTPLVFFTLLFVMLYKRFVVNPTWQLSLLMGVVAASMIYSKYHAFLILGLIVLSNLKLLRSKYFWSIAVISVALLIPHVIWQFENQFPSFKYHFVGRTKPLQLKYFFDNILSQVIIAGPLTGIIVFIGLSKFKTGNDLYKRALLFVVLGFYIFLGLFSFWNRIEAHWTVAATPLLMLTTYPIISENIQLKKWFIRLGIPTVALFALFRIYLIADVLPNVGHLKLAFYNRGATSEQIQEMAQGKPVAFFNNFASPGMYEFYTGEKCIHLSTPDYRYTQFDLWNDETIADNDSLFVVIPDKMEADKLITLKNGKKVKTVISQPFQSFTKLNIEIDSVQSNAKSIELTLKLQNNSDKTIYINHPSQPVLGWKQEKDKQKSIHLSELTESMEILPGKFISVEFEIEKEQIDFDTHLILFTQTAEQNRGKMTGLEVSEFK